MSLSVTAIGCLHGHYPKLDGGDLLIVTGDLTARHTREEFYDFANWMRNQDYEDKIVIPGNHDTWFEKCDTWDIKNWLNIGEFEFLCDSGTEIIYEEDNIELEKTIKIWGSPWSLWFEGINPHCTAFTGTEEELADKFALIPHDVDILVTHSPPFGILDSVDKGKRLTGSLSLRNRMMEVKPRIHVFSHIHEWGGKRLDTTLTKCINCSIMNEHYQPINKPIRINL